jgi:hypothetical protein
MIVEALRELPRTSQRAITFTWVDESIRTPILVFLVLRLVTWLGILAMTQLNPTPLASFMYHNPSGETYFQSIPAGSPFADLVEPWRRWDTAWYAKVAIQGYTDRDSSFVFPPLYPTLMRLLAPVMGGNYILAAETISTIACLIAFLLLFKLVELEFKDNKVLARNTLIVLAAFPTAYYLMAGYTESLFLALTLGAWVAALKKDWLFAGILGFFAALTRLQGAVICFPLAWIAYIQLRESGWRAIVQRIPAVVGAPLGSATYYAYIAINHIGSFDKAFSNEWQLYTRLPWESINAYIIRFQHGWNLLNDWEDRNAIALIVFAVLCLIVTFTQKPSFSLYSWATLCVILMRYHEGPHGESLPQFESAVRYVLSMFPCFIAVGMICQRWRQFLLIPYVYFGATIGWDLLDKFTHWKWVA